MNKQELYNKFEEVFRNQLDLELKDVLDVVNDKYVLKHELMAITMASLSLQMSCEDHGLMAEFLEMISSDR